MIKDFILFILVNGFLWNSSCITDKNGLIHMQHIHKYENKYLNQMHDLVLGATANLDCTIVLFGSRAHGVHRRSSDIDIGFSGLTETAFTRTRDRILSELEESIIPHHVDLVNFDTAPAAFRNVAMGEVIVWKQSSRAN